LAKEIDWNSVEKDFQEYYTNFGRPSVPIRKMIGLILLKQIYNLSDEAVVDRWIENPYWQYFCGEVNFQKDKPIDSTEFVHFRKRIGESGATKILKLSIKLFGNEAKETEVLIDSTVQEKNITFPTDAKLHYRIIKKIVKLSNKEGVRLRQTYQRTVRQLMIDQRFRNHPKRKKKANSASRKLKTIAGRLTRDFERKISDNKKIEYSKLLSIINKILTQKRNDKHKIYSIHEPEVSCIAKGKERQAYEFGNKSGFVVTSKSKIIIGALAFENNPYDGHTLEAQLNQVKELNEHSPKFAIVDRGYKGKNQINNTQIIIPKPLGKKATNYEKQKIRKRFRARAGIEPVIGHLKNDFRMIRNYLRGILGDKVNTILAAAAYNIKKKLNRIKVELLRFLYIFLTNIVSEIFNLFFV